MRNFFSKNVILPLSDLILGHSVYKSLNFLQESQWWSYSELKEYQDKQICALIKHAYEYVPYYTKLFKKLHLHPSDIVSINDLNKLPILTKDEIKRQGLENFTSTAFSTKKLIKLSSSGSTGEPLQFYKTKHAESFNKAAYIRAWYWMGYRLGDKYVKISMNPRNSIVKKLQDYSNNCKYLSSNQLRKKEFQQIKEEIIKFDPKFIRCYPIPLLFLSELIKETDNVYSKTLKGINTTGSTLHEDTREKIEKVFNTTIYDSYSCEGGAVCAQCNSSMYYHFAEEYALSEFIEDEYTKSDSDYPVRHITTDLQNFATPFIRYDTQDYITLGESKPCSCGRPYKNIKSIKGRDSDILITPSGKFLIVENFVAYFEWIESVDQIQVVQDKIDCLTINLVVNKKYTPLIEKEIYNYWKEYIGDDVILKVEIVNEIKLTPTGKRRTLIRNPEIKISI